MISEKNFVTSFNSSWQELAPTIQPYVRAINLGTFHFASPLKSKNEPKRRAIVNEISFLIFKSSINSIMSLKDIFESDELGKISEQSLSLAKSFQILSNEELIPATKTELKEALSLAERLKLYLDQNEKEQKINVSPAFKGCGFIDDCYGDLLIGKTLYESKAGDRTFRLVDLKQILVYLALNYANKSYDIQDVGFVNPRLGIYYKVKATEFSFGVSGKDLIELLSEIVEFISSGGLSK
jgi:hypothetical protein